MNTLSSGGLEAGGVAAEQAKARSAARADAKLEAAQRAAEAAHYGEAFSGKAGLSGIMAAVRQIAFEVCTRLLGNINIVGGNDIQVSGRGGNWVITRANPVVMAEPAARRGAAAARPPLQLVAASVSTKLRVTYGTVNGIAATGMAVGDIPPYEFTPSGGTVYGECAIVLGDTPSVTTFDILSGASVPATTAAHVYFLIGTYATVSGAFVPVSNLTGSQWVSLCGSATSEVPVVTMSKV